MTIFVSLDSSSPAQCAAVRNEIDAQGGAYDLDPLQILLYEESEGEFDANVAHDVLKHRHAKAAGCSFPQCYVPCGNCNK